jgi:hypothetical protein
MNTIKTICVFLLSLAMLTSCKEKKEPEVQTVPVESKNILDADVPKQASPGAIKSIPITVKEAAKQISELLGHKTLERMAKRVSLGGYFYARPFKITGGDDAAIILWNCYNLDDPEYPTLFVAVEQVAKYDTTAPPPAGPVASSLITPVATFNFTGSSNAEDSVLKFMRIPRKPEGTEPLEKTISKELAEKFIANFKAMIGTLEVVTGAKYSAYPLAAFGNNDYYKRFEARPHKFVKYYLTLYFDTRHRPNYLRPVLGVAGDDGILIEIKNTRQDPPMMQKSWPPPPN